MPHPSRNHPKVTPRTARGTTARTVAVAALTALTATALAACGSDDGARLVESSDAVTGSLPAVDNPAEIRDTLAGTDWECLHWSEVDSGDSGGAASCVLPGDSGIHAVYVNGHPAETASVIFQSTPETPAVVIGNNWLFDCGPDATLGIDRCGDIAAILGGTIVLPDPV